MWPFVALLDENVPVLQISDYEDFPLPFNLEDLLDAGPMTIENLLDIPSSDPVTSSGTLDNQMLTELDSVAFYGEAPYLKILQCSSATES